MKPIIFSGQSVQAILDGRKTQTRRVVHKGIVNGFDVERDGKTVIAYMEQATGDAYEPERAARYQKGDILWVRETWCYNNFGCFYRADWLNDNCPDMDFDDKWRSPIHMPRAAARLFLRVTDVRVERLQDISDADAIAEGITHLFDDMTDEEYDQFAARASIHHGGKYKAKDDYGYTNYLWHGNFGKYGMGNKQSDAWKYQYSAYEFARDSYSSLWELINAKRGHPWESNPWVWVYTFERIEKPEEGQMIEC